MTVKALGFAAGPDRIWAHSVDGTPDLVHLHPAIRTMLSGVDERVIVAVMLTAVLFGGDALRYGQPPVTVRLRFNRKS